MQKNLVLVCFGLLVGCFWKLNVDKLNEVRYYADSFHTRFFRWCTKSNVNGLKKEAVIYTVVEFITNARHELHHFIERLVVVCCYCFKISSNIPHHVNKIKMSQHQLNSLVISTLEITRRCRFWKKKISKSDTFPNWLGPSGINCWENVRWHASFTPIRYKVIMLSK